MRLSKEVVLELQKVREQISALSEREEVLTKAAKKQMRKQRIEEFAPANCPYKLVLNRFEKSFVQWKEQWRKVAKLHYGYEWKKYRDRLVKKSRRKQDQLLVKPHATQ